MAKPSMDTVRSQTSSTPSPHCPDKSHSIQHINEFLSDPQTDQADHDLSCHVEEARHPPTFREKNMDIKNKSGKSGESPHESGEQNQARGVADQLKMIGQPDRNAKKKAPDGIDQKVPQGKAAPNSPVTKEDSR